MSRTLYEPAPKDGKDSVLEGLLKIIDAARTSDQTKVLSAESYGEYLLNIDLVESDLKERSEFGKKKYGTELKTFNGRKPLIDLYQELLDALMYSTQDILESENNPTFTDQDHFRKNLRSGMLFGIALMVAEELNKNKETTKTALA